MTQRRIVINVKPTGWIGWLLVALLAVPLLILSFFFVAAAVALAAVIVAVSAARIYWLRRKARKREPFVYGNGGRQRGGEIIDIEPADIDGADAMKSGLPRLP
jgi:hypothetical protein